jgi:ADP-ribose pyrophosphatase
LTEESISSEHAFAGRLISVRVDTVRLPSGRTTTREVVEHRGAVAIVAMLDSEQVALVKQYRRPADKVLLEIPAGTLAADESPEACAQRELTEETGYQAGRLLPLYHTYLAPGYSTEMLHCFLALDLTPAAGRPELDEQIEVQMIGLDEAEAMAARGEIEDAKTLCGLLMARRALERAAADTT